MTTTYIFGEIVTRHGSGGNPTHNFPFKIGDIIPHLDYAVAGAFAQHFANETKNNGHSVLGSDLTKSADVDVVLGDCGDTSIKLPYSIINLPDQRGVHEVLYGNRKAERTTPDYLNRFQGLESLALSREAKFWVIDDTVHLYNLPKGTKKVQLLLIPKPSSLDEDEELRIPAGYEDQIIDKVLKRMIPGFRTPEDTVNEGNK